MTDDVGVNMLAEVETNRRPPSSSAACPEITGAVATRSANLANVAACPEAAEAVELSGLETAASDD